VTQSEEEIKQRLINCLKDIEWDITQGKIDTVMTKLEEAQKLTQEWGKKHSNHQADLEISNGDAKNINTTCI
jgi:hypothetical protein